MQLQLCKLPSTLRGAYDINRDGIKNELAERMLFAHPDLARAILKLEKDGIRLRYSDIFRSAASSLARRKEFESRGGPQLAKRPGESPHNWGLAVDIDVADALSSLKLKRKADLDQFLRGYGLHCHRLDGLTGPEAWHYNCLGTEIAPYFMHASPRSTSRAIEAKIQALYGGAMSLSRDEIISGLRALKHLGKEATSVSYTAAVKCFQRDWDLTVDGVAGPKTQRLLAYLTANTQLVIP
jgi:hypothetical protein